MTYRFQFRFIFVESGEICLQWWHAAIFLRYTWQKVNYKRGLQPHPCSITGYNFYHYTVENVCVNCALLKPKGFNLKGFNRSQ